MKNPKIEKLIIKYVTRSISAIEMDKLEVWLDNPANEKLFSDYVKINYAIDINLSNYSIEKTKLIL